MALQVGMEIVPGQTKEIPVPSRPADNGDIDAPAKYIPVGMSAENRKALREAALEWSDTLGGLVVRNHPTKSQAGLNMHHYRHGEGKDRKYSSNEVDDIEKSITPEDRATHGGIVQRFISLISIDMKMGGFKVKRYLAKNLNKNNYWFGLNTVPGTEWYYGIGGFLMAYGAYAIRMDGRTKIYYRMYIYDRYNWDIWPEGDSKSTTLSTDVGWMLDEDEIEGAENLKFFKSQNYFEKSKMRAAA